MSHVFRIVLGAPDNRRQPTIAYRSKLKNQAQRMSNSIGRIKLFGL